MRRAEAPEVEVWALALLLFAATDPVYALAVRGASDWVTAADLARVMDAKRPVWAVIYLGAAVWLWRARAQVAGAAAGHPALPLALGWFGASCLWAPAPASAAVGFAQFGLLLAAGLAAGVRLGALGTLRAVARLGWLALGASAVMAAAAPELAFGQQVNAGALRGAYVEKNHLAMILSYGFAAAAFEAAARPGRPGLWAAAAALAAGVVAARSATALVQVALAAGLLAAWAGLARARFGGAAMGAAALGLAALAAAAAPGVVAALGKDLTLNDRTVLWAALWPHMADRPLIGHGFFGFWNTEAGAQVRAAMGWNAAGAHNGWLTAQLYGGAVGLALWLALWAGPARRAAGALVPGADPARAGLGALVVAHLLWSAVESNQLMQMNVHALLAGLCLSLAAVRRPSRAAAARPAARSRNAGLPIT